LDEASRRNPVKENLGLIADPLVVLAGDLHVAWGWADHNPDHVSIAS
jgi:hypothetical protein